MQVSESGLRWFQDAKFGMFVNWGSYSVLGAGEWSMYDLRKVPLDHSALAEQFNPERFDADDLVGLAADAGQRYLTHSTRHHDGFSMYDTALSPYKCTNTPFKRDALAEVAEACAKHEVKLGVYVSLIDWSHPAYRASRRTASGMAWDDYVGFLHGQVRELCTGYGPLAQVWFDGDWPLMPFDDPEYADWFQPGGAFGYEDLYGLIHQLQPDAVVLNNRHVELQPGEDVQGFEKDLPGNNTSGFNETLPGDNPLETCLTINDSWGFHQWDHDYKSAEDLVRVLVRAAAAGANLLLNVGPTADGEVPEPQRQRLAAVGAWLRVHGHTLYGTRASRLQTPPGVVSTHANGTDFLHLLGDEAPEQFVVAVPGGGEVSVQAPHTIRNLAVTSFEL
ncbi:alpha-L-fucosidase [Luteipulveratus mongoliensis]|uniref:alpha-L-fucosidase n=1 Tax=Luteipulveratus mongoliensis TaxID=571913 RepID=UPI0006964736|nr:alpha-L-fucosidase [Luteipulveratus mongoliensis]